MKEIIMHPIGFISSPFTILSEVPRQASLAESVEAYVEVKKTYQQGLDDLDGFSHALILFYFHKSTREDIKSTPYTGNVARGIFAIRSPHRPNHIGCSVVSIKRIEKNRLYFTRVDMVDKTPVLDIKPYIPSIDNQKTVSLGWVNKYLDQRNENNK